MEQTVVTDSVQSENEFLPIVMLFFLLHADIMNIISARGEHHESIKYRR